MISKNKTVLITGATGGLGLSIAEEFYEKKYNLILTGTNDIKLKSLESKFTNNTKVIKCNLAEQEDILKMFDIIPSEFDGVDILINNAGITKDNLTIRMSLEEWSKVININLTSTFLMCKYSIKKMLKIKSGKIINITSVVGHTGNVGQANYTASKAGIVAMSKSLAIEYAKKNINVNCISPGFISTTMTDQIDEKFKETIIAKIPSNRLGKPEDIANAVNFLSSDQSDYINGETLHVNGGMYLG